VIQCRNGYAATNEGKLITESLGNSFASNVVGQLHDISSYTKLHKFTIHPQILL